MRVVPLASVLVSLSLPALSVAPVSSAEAPVQALSERRRGRERERLRPRTADRV
jgi:hypothetical protein